MTLLLQLIKLPSPGLVVSWTLAWRPRCESRLFKMCSLEERILNSFVSGFFNKNDRMFKYSPTGIGLVLSVL